MTIRTPIVIASACGFLLGVGGASAVFTAHAALHPLVIAGVMGASLFAVWELAPRSFRAVAITGIVAAAIGVIRFLSIVPPTGSLGVPSDRAMVHVMGVVQEAIAPDATRFRITVRRPVITTVDHQQPPAAYRPAVLFLNRRMDIRYGDRIDARCTWRTSMRARDRLTIAGTCSVPQSGLVRVTARGGGSATIRMLRAWSAAWRDHLSVVLDPRASGLVNAMLFGDGAGLEPTFLDAFRRTGTIHLLVVSGTHMTALAFAVRLLIGTFLPRALRAGITVYVIAALVAMIGFQPSVVRGALLATVLLAIPVLGRVPNPRRLLLLLAVGMVFVHPHVLAFDLGFQLSVLATGGILFVLPWAEQSLRSPWRTELRAMLAASVAATLATAPVLVAAFGYVAILSPIVNLLVLPFAPMLMVLGVVLLVATVGGTSLVPLLAAITNAVAGAFIGIVTAAARIPGVVWSVGTIDPWFALLLEVLLAALTVRWYRRHHIPLFATEFRTHTAAYGATATNRVGLSVSRA